MTYTEALLGNNEEIVYETRQHGWVLFKAIALDIVLFSVLMYAGGWWAYIRLLAFLPLGHFFWKFADWKLRTYLVTTRRVIEIQGVISKRTSDSSLEKVNDVILTQSLFGRMFHFGDIEILTGAEQGINRLNHIADPLEFKRHMLDQKEGIREDVPHLVRNSDSDDVPRLIQELDALRQRGLLTEAEFARKKQELLARL